MAVITKWLEDEHTTLLVESFYPGGKNTSTVGVRNYKYAAAERHRRKPLVPDITGMMFVHNWASKERVTFTFPGLPEYYTVGPAGALPGSNGPILQYLDDGSAAVTRALAKLYNAKGSFGESLVEGKQTTDMLNKRLRQLYNIAKTLKHGSKKQLERALQRRISHAKWNKVKEARTAGRALRDGALEIQYGWLPIVELIEDAVGIYANGLYERGQTIRVGSGSSRLEQNPELGPDPVLKPVAGSARLQFKIRSSVLANATALGLSNPLREAWNKVGLSFVFDWFIPVGTYLSALTAQAGLDVQLASVTDVSQSDSYKTIQGKAYIVERFVVCQRRLAFVSPSMEVLWTGNGLDSWSKIVNFALLASQRLR